LTIEAPDNPLIDMARVLLLLGSPTQVPDQTAGAKLQA
jgi:hypothetical protein